MLTDVLENFTSTDFKTKGIQPSQSYTALSFAWMACFKNVYVEIELAQVSDTS